MTPTVTSRVDDLIDRACSATGLSDFGGDSWRRGLEVLVTAGLSEARFNELGEQAFHDGIVKVLSNRLRIESWFTRHPEIAEQEVHVELLGVGFPRTGSTALAFLLALDDRFRCLRTWEDDDPCPPPGLDPDADRRRIAAAEAGIDFLTEVMPPQFLSMLPRDARGPTEDHALMALEFTAQSFIVTADIPSYAEWLLDCDMEPTYRYERRALQLLQWRTPQTSWRLKSPTHTLFLEAFVTVFPHARFVQTHRDPGKVLASVSDLYVTLQSPFHTEVDPVAVGELNVHQWALALDRMLAFRSKPGNDEKFFDIGFAAFQDDPIESIGDLYRWLGHDLTEAVTDRMRHWRSDHPRDERARGRPDRGRFGITDEVLDSRFGAYREQFGAFLGS